MYKTLGVIGAIILILFKFFGLKGLIIILCIGVAILGLIYKNQNSILYIPLIPNAPLSPSGNPIGWRHPSQQGCHTENVQMKTADDVTLRGWLLKSDQSQRLIIYFHENAGNLGIRISYLKNIQEYTNSDLLIVAYRGFSDSQGTPTETGLQRDAEAILDWAIAYKNRKLAQENVNLNIYLLGRSLGGAVSLYVSTKQAYSKEISGLILENTFTSIKDMISAVMPFLKPFSFLQKNYWPSATRIVLVKQPILFIRCLQDEIVPTQQMVELINNAVNAKFKVEHQIPKGTHNVAWELNPDAYFDEFNGFFQRNEQK